MTRCALAAALVLAAAALPARAEERREAAPHQHGAGTLSIAIEGSRLELELDAPAADVIGFEHAPRDDAERARAAEAFARFKDAGRLFRLDAAAGCTATTIDVELEGGGGEPGKEGQQEAHADISGKYKFDCSAIAALRRIELGYFAAFPAAQRLEVTVVTAKGQTTATATPATAVVALPRD